MSSLHCRCSKALLSFALALLLPAILFAQSSEKEIRIVERSTSIRLIASLPKHIKEASGLELTGDTLWTHNDGGLPILFGLDTAGNILKTIQLAQSNSGWEDLTLDHRGNLYVGAFGNNKNDKRVLKILIVAKPSNIKEKLSIASEIEFQYEDQSEFPPLITRKNFDADALVAKGDSLYIFTKNRTEPFTGYTKVYRLPQHPGKYKATLVDSIYLGGGPMIDNWVTGADLSPDGKTLVLLSHRSLWIIKDFKGSEFSAGTIYRVNFNHFSHKAGVCFSRNDKIFIVDEREFDLLGGKLYAVDLNQVVNPQ